MGGSVIHDAQAPRRLKMRGNLEDGSLIEFLESAERLELYAHVQISGGARNGSLYLASGRIVVAGGEEIMQRRIAQQKIVELLRENSSSVGSFECLPLVNMANVDGEASISIGEALRAAAATQASAPVVNPEPVVTGVAAPTHEPPPAAKNQPGPLPTSTSSRSGAGVPPPPLRPVPPAVTPGEADGRIESEIRPMRASQLRKMLRDARASLEDDDDQVTHQDELVAVVSTGQEQANRADALRSIIRRLAS